MITNHHVIEPCIGVENALTIALPNEDPIKAVIVKWDEENDIANEFKASLKNEKDKKKY